MVGVDEKTFYFLTLSYISGREIIFTEDYSTNKHTDKAQNGIRKMLFNFMKRLDEEVTNGNDVK